MTFPNVGTKNAAIWLLIFFCLLFFCVALWLSLSVGQKELAADVWKLFAGTFSGLLLILNAESKKDDSASDGSHANPTK